MYFKFLSKLLLHVILYKSSENTKISVFCHTHLAEQSNIYCIIHQKTKYSQRKKIIIISLLVEFIHKLITRMINLYNKNIMKSKLILIHKQNLHCVAWVIIVPVELLEFLPRELGYLQGIPPARETVRATG